MIDARHEYATTTKKRKQPEIRKKKRYAG